MLLSTGPVPGSLIKPAESEGAVGLKRAHLELVGQGAGLAVVAFRVPDLVSTSA
jgi:hypothetical protein